MHSPQKMRCVQCCSKKFMYVYCTQHDCCLSDTIRTIIGERQCTWCHKQNIKTVARGQHTFNKWNIASEHLTNNHWIFGFWVLISIETVFRVSHVSCIQKLNIENFERFFFCVIINFGNFLFLVTRKHKPILLLLVGYFDWSISFWTKS